DTKKLGTRLYNASVKLDGTFTPLVINMAGGSASGKTTLKKEWLAALHKMAQVNQASIVEDIELDSYYKDYSQPLNAMGHSKFFSETNLDEPAAMTLDVAAQDVATLKQGQEVRIPEYS